jgi:predicted nuclease of predicted toxin-antitoxin system
MTVAFYMDEHIRREITIELRKRGVDVLTVQEDGRTSFPDPIILDRAMELQRVMFSQDRDFLTEANRRQQTGVKFAGVIYARQLGVTIGDCVRDLEIIAKASHPEDLANCVQYLPL